MGFWNKAGRWLAWAIGLLFVIIGFNAFWHGLDIIQVERGWTGVIAGTTAMCTGMVMILLTVLIDRVDALRLSMLSQRALQVVDAAPETYAEPLPSTVPVEPEPPKPVEVAVEPLPTPAAASPAGFRFRNFGKRRGADRPPMPIETPQVEPAAEAPADAIPRVEPEQPPEQIRRFAPPQFRRPTVVPPEPEVEAPAPATEMPPEPAPELPEVVAAEPAGEPIPLTVNLVRAEVSVEASITQAIAEELRLPRATNLASMPPVADEALPAEPAAQDVFEPEPAPEAMPEPVPEPLPQVAEAPAPAAEAAAPPPQGVAQTHEWLEKALTAEEQEPGLDWLRQRRPEAKRPERKLPSFMRRHVAEEPAAEQPPAPEPQPVAPPQPDAYAAHDFAPQAAAPDHAPEADVAQAEAAQAATPSVVGRYSANGSDYTLYADGSIDAQTPEGPHHFASMDELRGFLQHQKAPTPG